MNRQTGIRMVLRCRGEEAERAEIAAAIEQAGGCLVRAAHYLVISRRHLYRLVYRAQLWDVVDAAREGARRIPEQIRRARQEVRSWTS